MSADRPYQSHLFNSLNRNVQRAKDKAGLLWRNWVINVKVAVLWGAQMASYPVYAVLNASRQVSKQVEQIGKHVSEQVGQQLRTIGRSTRGPLTDSALSPQSDAPLTSVLTALITRQIATLPVGDADCLTIVLAQGTQIQGFASTLSTRRLTIVTTTNETLDILSERQENELRQRIIYEIASYWRLMRSRPLSPSVSSLKVSSLKVSSLKVSAAVQIPTLWTDRSSLSSSGASLGSQRDWSALIQAAWYYFFGGLFDGRGRSQFWGRPVKEIAYSGPSSQISEAQTDIWVDPWTLDSPTVLTIQPIVTRYDRPKRLGVALKAALTLPAAEPIADLPLVPTLSFNLSLFNTLKNWIQSRLGFAPLATTPSLSNSSHLSKPAIPVLTARPNAFLSAPSRPSRAATKRIARAPEWLDIPATSLGYDVSWLDRMVLALDKAIVFLERIFLTFWAWLQVLRKS